MLHTHCWYSPKTLACLLNWLAVLKKKKNLHLQVSWSHLDTLAQKFHQHRHSTAPGWEEHLKKNTLMEQTSPVWQSPCCLLICATAEERSLFYPWVVFSFLHLPSQCWTEKRTGDAIDLHPTQISSVGSFPRHRQTLTFFFHLNFDSLWTACLVHVRGLWIGSLELGIWGDHLAAF